MRGAVVRLQPDVAVADGYDPALLRAVADALGAPTMAYSRTLRIPLDEDPNDAVLVARLADALDETGRDAGLIVIDMTFDPSILRAATNGDVWLSSALRELAKSGRATKLKFVVLVESLPSIADSIYDVATGSAYGQRLGFVDPEGASMFVVEGVDLTRLAPILRPAEAPFQLLELGTLRQRGVFASHHGQRSSHYLFHYDVLKNAQPALRELLSAYLKEANADIVVFDSASASSWFASTLAAACIDAGVGRVDVGSLTASAVGPTQGESESESLSRGRAALYEETAVVCYAVPAYESGSTLARLHEQVGRDDWDTAKFLTVYLKDERAQAANSSPTSTLKWITRRKANRAMRVDFVLQVPITMIAAKDWKLTVARLLDEVKSVTADVDFGGEPTSNPLNPSRVGMWSLFEDYGTGDETPPASGRPPFRYFPKLRELDDSDAFWLAEAAIQTFHRDGKAAREQTLVVLPVERLPIGDDPLRRALHRCGVSVLALPRSVIDGEDEIDGDAYQKLDDFSDSRIVVFDESTVSHGTFTRIADLIEDKIKRRPDHFLAVLDLSPVETSDPPVVSFARWTPTETIASGVGV